MRFLLGAADAPRCFPLPGFCSGANHASIYKGNLALFNHCVLVRINEWFVSTGRPHVLTGGVLSAVILVLVFGVGDRGREEDREGDCVGKG